MKNAIWYKLPVMDENQPHLALSILYWLAWLICGFLVVVDLLEIREASLDVLTAIEARRVANAAEGEANFEQFDATMHTIDIGMGFLGAMLAVSLAVGIEYYFRAGLKQGKLVQRIGKVVGIQVAIIPACVIVGMLVNIF